MLLLSIISVWSLLFQISGGFETEADVCASELIRHWGYPAEVHNVTTEDGYILNLFRIPNGRHSETNSSCTRPAILLAHGTGVGSNVFLINPPASNPALILADAGFDVFLLDHRGTTYSKRHTTLSPGDNKFWQFTLDELAKFDVPASIDKVLTLTGQPSLYFIGYSQGTVIGFMTLAENPAYNSKVKAMFQLGPAGTLGFGRGFLRFAVTAYNALKPVMDFCNDEFSLVMGQSTRSINWTRVPFYASYVPGGTSTWTFLHWAQLAAHGKVEHMDHNPQENLRRYGQITPPPYDYHLIDVPIYLFWSRDDWVTTPEDIEHIILKLLRKEVVKGGREIPGYNHADFAIAEDCGKMVYEPIADIVRSKEQDMCDR